MVKPISSTFSASTSGLFDRLEDVVFAAFGKDPDWITAREASEKVAGGSLTEKKGVVSEFFTATEYSPLR